MSLRKLIFAALVVALVASGCSSFAEAAALVNGDKISQAELEDELNRVRDDPNFAEIYRREGVEQRGEYRRRTLTVLIQMAVMRQQAQEMGIRVTERQIDDFVDEIRRSVGGQAEFERILEEAQVTEEQARTVGERQIIERELRRKVTEDLEVSDAEVRRAYEQNKAAYEEVHLLRITVASEQQANQVLERLTGGAPFAEVARATSADPLASKGGDMGYVPLSELDRQVQAAIQGVPAGGFTEPVPTAEGFAVYQVLERRPQPLQKVRDEIADSLLSQEREQAFQDWLVEQVREARVVINPKYGRFDPQALQVVPAPDALPR